MLSPDPITQAPENGQNYNRYTYAFNNPLKYVDPSGFRTALTNNKKTYVIDDGFDNGGGGGTWFGGHVSIDGDALEMEALFSAPYSTWDDTTREQIGDDAASIGAQRLSDQEGRVTEYVEYGDNNFHSYTIRGLICSASNPSCNAALADAVYEHVNQNDIPFTTRDSETGVMVLFGDNPIDHREDIGNRTSVNITLDDHVFFPGDVTHRVFFEDGDLYYEVVGTGTGDWRRANTSIGFSLFRPGVEAVVNEFGF